jgi:hypothetical protein
MRRKENEPFSVEGSQRQWPAHLLNPTEKDNCEKTFFFPFTLVFRRRITRTFFNPVSSKKKNNANSLYCDSD